MAAVGHFVCPKLTFDSISGHFRSMRNFFLLKIFTKWPPAPILDVRNSLSFLAVSDQCATLFFLEIFDKMAVRNSLSIAFLAILDQYGIFIFLDFFYKMAAGVIGSDVPWLECLACNALTWVITVTE